jgi:hypothetical protein
MMARSREAADLDAHARRYVDLLDRDKYDGRMPYERASEVYRTAVAAQAHRYMMDQLEPINRQLLSIAALSLEPLTVPPAVEELRQSIISKWTRAVEELILPQSPPATPPAP